MILNIEQEVEFINLVLMKVKKLWILDTESFIYPYTILHIRQNKLFQYT